MNTHRLFGALTVWAAFIALTGCSQESNRIEPTPIEITGLSSSITLRDTQSDQSWIVNSQEADSLYLPEGVELEISQTPSLKTCRFNGIEKKITYRKGINLQIGCQNKVLIQSDTYDGSFHISLWLTDGDVLTKLKDIPPSQAPAGLASKYYELNDNLVFLIGSTLWATNGTPEGTTPIQLNGIQQVSWLKELAHFNNDLFFATSEVNSRLYRFIKNTLEIEEITLSDRLTTSDVRDAFYYNSELILADSFITTSTLPIFSDIDIDYPIRDGLTHWIGIGSRNRPAVALKTKHDETPAIQLDLPFELSRIKGVVLSHAPQSPWQSVFQFVMSKTGSDTDEDLCSTYFQLSEELVWIELRNNCSATDSLIFDLNSISQYGPIFNQKSDTGTDGLYLYSQNSFIELLSFEHTDTAQLRTLPLNNGLLIVHGRAPGGGGHGLAPFWIDMELYLSFIDLENQKSTLLLKGGWAYYFGLFGSYSRGSLGCLSDLTLHRLFDSAFYAIPSENNRLTLWKTNGTIEGTQPILPNDNSVFLSCLANEF